MFASAAQGALADTALQAADLDTFAELQALVADGVIIQQTAIDTFAELDAIVADGSLLQQTAIDTLAELNAIVGDATLVSAVEMSPGSGWDSVGVYHSSVEKVGALFKTTIYVDLTGAKSSTTDLDVIGADKGADAIVNGAFTGDTDWTKGATWNYGTNNMDADTGAGSVLSPAVALVAVVGKTYELTYTMSSFVGGTCVASFGGQSFTARGSDATFVERIVATSTADLNFTADAAADYTIDDVILKEVPLAHLGQITAAVNGAIFDAEVTWLETPTTGADDIDFYSATENSGAFDDPGATDLTETSLYAKGSAAAGARETPISLTALPAANEYLYLFGGEAGTAGTYGAGILRLVLWGA